MPSFNTHPFLSLAGIGHGFFGRAGGVSTGLYASLNCGPGSRDNPAHVVQNRARVAETLEVDPQQLVTLAQVHSSRVVTVDAPWETSPPEADALVSRVPGLMLGILTADCAPVLFADPVARVIGAAHAGWKGAMAGVLDQTQAAMVALGAVPARMVAVVGPTIAARSYEVGPEFLARFAIDEQARFFVPSARPQHYQFDLPGYVLHRLRRAGVGKVAALAVDTCAQPEAFFSYRRATRAAEPDYGRQMSVIVLR